MNYNKITICILILIVCQVSYCQQKEPIEKRMSDDICTCFGEYNFTVADEQSRQALDTCNSKTIVKYRVELESYFKESKDGDYLTGYKAGKQFFEQKIAPLLVRDCEALKKILNLD